MLHLRSFCLGSSRNFVQTLAIDLLNPSAEHERKQHKLKRLVQSPNSFFMDVKCPGASCRARHNTINLTALFALGCFAITTVFSNAQSVVLCGSCASVLCQPTGGRARLTEGMSSNYDVCHALTWIFRRLLIPTEELDASLHSSSLVKIVQAGLSYAALYHYLSPSNPWSQRHYGKQE